MAPVELVSLARCIVERHIGFRRHRPAVLRPPLGEPAHRIVATLITQGAQFFEDADQGQPFSGRLARVGRQELLQLTLPWSDPRHLLPFALVAEIRLVRPEDLTDRVRGDVQLSHDPLHRPALDIEGPTDPRDRIHPLQLPLRPLPRNERSDRTSGGSKLDADTPT